MGKSQKAFKDFVESIPDERLSGFSDGSRTIVSDDNFRLDNQGLTTPRPVEGEKQVEKHGLAEKLHIGTSKKHKKDEHKNDVHYSQNHNLQIQVNHDPKLTSLKGYAPRTVSTVEVSKDHPAPPGTIRKAFKDNCVL